MKNEQINTEAKTAWATPKISIIDIKKTLSGGASSSDSFSAPTG